MDSSDEDTSEEKRKVSLRNTESIEIEKWLKRLQRMFYVRERDTVCRQQCKVS